MNSRFLNIQSVALLALFFSTPTWGDSEKIGNDMEKIHTINFRDIPVVEFIRFVSRISGSNFIYDDKELQFNVSLSSGKNVSSQEVVKGLINILNVHGLSITEQEGYLVIHKIGPKGFQENRSQLTASSSKSKETIIGTVANLKNVSLLPTSDDFLEIKTKEPDFLVQKLQFHSGEDIEIAIKKIASDLASKPEISRAYLSALESVHLVKTTNSLVCSGDASVLPGVKKLIESLDVPLRQVFIEVLVIETDVKNSLDFGIQWAAGGKVKDGLGIGMGNFAPGHGPSPFATAFQSINAAHTPTGPSQIPLGKGFDMGVIGDIIFHKGASFVSLGALVSALQADGDSSIVLNQKIITQDNKNSTIFVGDNIPFTGSVVQTIGTGQQTTANVEYRDVGVMLSITPRLGDGDVITLDIKEEITEAVADHHNYHNSSTQINGIQTTKTNMMTHVHVPDNNFLVLSGMIRNAHIRRKAGLPCLGGLPFIGSAFSKNHKRAEKRNIIMFVKPHIIYSAQDYKNVTEDQKELFRSQAESQQEFDQSLDLVN